MIFLCVKNNGSGVRRTAPERLFLDAGKRRVELLWIMGLEKPEVDPQSLGGQLGLFYEHSRDGMSRTPKDRISLSARHNVLEQLHPFAAKAFPDRQRRSRNVRSGSGQTVD